METRFICVENFKEGNDPLTNVDPSPWTKTVGIGDTQKGVSFSIVGPTRTVDVWGYRRQLFGVKFSRL